MAGVLLMKSESMKGKVELYNPESPTDLTEDYLTIFELVGEGYVDMLKISFTNLNDVYVKVIIDDELYYELLLEDLKNKINLNKDEQDTFLNTAGNSFSDSYPIPLLFENSFRVEAKKIRGNKKVKGAIIRYRLGV
jgi:flagellar motor switch protein FliM